MDIKLLMTDIGLSLLQAQDPDPSKPYNGPTKKPEKLDEEMDSRFQDWSSTNGRIEMSSVIDSVPKGAAKIKADIEEKAVLQSVRDKVEQLDLKEVSFFPNFKTGPLIGKARFGQNLETILNSSAERDIFLNAFNLPGLNAPDTDWKKHMNKHRREHDLVMVLGVFKLLMLIEVKGGAPGNFGKQFRCFKDYMERSHGTFLDNVHFLPVLARSIDVSNLCKDYQFAIQNVAGNVGSPSLETWWDTYLPPQNQMGVVPDEMTPLLKRMLMTSSLVLTSLPQQLSSLTPDSHLIILRKCQWDLFASRPAFAVIQGDAKTGKSMALEIGLALLGGEQSSRILISMEDEYNFQNVIRKSFFNNSGIAFRCYEKLADIQLGTLDDDSLICIDDFPAEDLKKQDVQNSLKALKAKSKYLWLAMKKPSKSCEQDSKSLEFNFVQF